MLDWLATSPEEPGRRGGPPAARSTAPTGGPFPSAGRWAAGRGTGIAAGKTDRCSHGLSLLICADVIRPSLDWLLATPRRRNWRQRWPGPATPRAFAVLSQHVPAAGRRATPPAIALARIAMIMAAKGGRATTSPSATASRCASCPRDGRQPRQRPRLPQPLLLPAAARLGGFPATAPPTTRAFNVRGQMSVEEMIDRYGIQYRPIRDLLVDYLREFQVCTDYIDRAGAVLCPGQAVLAGPGAAPPRHRLAAPAPRGRRGLEAADWHQDDQDPGPTARSPRPTPPGCRPRHLVTVRAFYLDIAAWAADDPARWGRGSRPAHPGRRADQRAQDTPPPQVPDGPAHPRTPPVLPALAAAAEPGAGRPRNGWQRPRPPARARIHRRREDARRPVMPKAPDAGSGRGPGHRQTP